MTPRRTAAQESAPQVVLVLPDRALRLLWGHAFAAAGWRAHVADTALDALATAFNSEAEVVVTGLASSGGSETGLAVLREFARDEELSGMGRYLLVPAGIAFSATEAEGIAVFEEPCDPFWLISDADAHLGRTTPAGLGHRPFSDADVDVALHHWWWSLAVADLVCHVAGMREAAADRWALATMAADRLGRRIDAAVTFVPAASGRPEGREFSRLRPEAPVREVLVVSIGGGEGSLGWWRITPPEEGLTAHHIECIGALAAALAGERPSTA